MRLDIPGSALQSIQSFLSDYVNDPPSISAINQFLENKNSERDWRSSLQQQIITEAELTDVLFAHALTRFANNHPYDQNLSEVHVRRFSEIYFAD